MQRSKIQEILDQGTVLAMTQVLYGTYNMKLNPKKCKEILINLKQNDN